MNKPLAHTPTRDTCYLRGKRPASAFQSARRGFPKTTRIPSPISRYFTNPTGSGLLSSGGTSASLLSQYLNFAELSIPQSAGKMLAVYPAANVENINREKRSISFQKVSIFSRRPSPPGQYENIRTWTGLAESYRY